MKYISIGDACNVKYNIDKYRDKSETLFFDWLITSFKSVIEILECKDINNILYPENFIINVNKPYNEKEIKVVIKSLDCCISIHDLHINYNDKDILNFIDKYSRRFNRIIQYIKSNEKICFLRLGNHVNYDEIYKFIETIKKININCDFTIVFIDNNKNNNTEILKQPNFLHIKLNINKDNNMDWTDQHLNWNNIFLEIEKNI